MSITVQKYSKNEVARVCALAFQSSIDQSLSSSHRPVVCFISGGSVGTDVLPQWIDLLKCVTPENISRLAVVLGDERYGAIHHPESNMVLLSQTGFLAALDELGVRYELPLRADETGNDGVGCAQDFERRLCLLLADEPDLVGLFGIGVDGHTAGIKPVETSLFADLFMDERCWAVYFRGNDFERITITVPFMKKLTTALVYGCGNQKQAVLRQLINNKDILVSQFPAGIYHHIHPSIIFTDQTI